MVFWIPWAIDAAAALVFVYFFFVGLADGSVGADNMLLWLLILAVAGIIVVGSLVLRSRGRFVPSTLLVVVPAFPAVLLGLFFLVLMLFWPSH